MGWHGSGSRQGIEPATGAAAYFHRLVNVPAWPGCRPPLACPRRAIGCNGKRKASPEGQAIGDGVFTARPPVPDLRRHGRLPLLAGGRRRSIGGGHQPSGGGGRQAEVSDIPATETKGSRDVSVLGQSGRPCHATSWVSKVGY